MTYISWRFWLLCEWKISFEIGSLRYVEYIEKKPDFIILTSLKSQMFFINHGSLYSTLFQKVSSQPSEAISPKLIIVWPYKNSIKWGQCLSVLKIRSCWCELTELLPGRWSPKYLHIKVQAFFISMSLRVLWNQCFL